MFVQTVELMRWLGVMARACSFTYRHCRRQRLENCKFEPGQCSNRAGGREIQERREERREELGEGKMHEI